MTLALWFVIAVFCNFAGYAVYLAGLRRQLVRPNRASWLIWSAAIGVEASTYAAVNPGAAQSLVFLISAMACLVVTIFIWRGSAWSAPSVSEMVCMAVCLAAIVLWAAFSSAFWAHLLVVAAVPISFWPTWQSAMHDRSRERSPAWGLWTIADLATLLLAIRVADVGVGGLAYIFVELACHASLWFMVGLATINPARSFGFRNGRFFVLDAYPPAASLFSVGESHLGRAVYAAQRFAEGAEIIRFTGPVVSADRLPTVMRGPDDHYVQVGEGRYMGPSGRVDDLINHSCTPNAGLRFTNDGVFLIATQPIGVGEEITWDYSTTLIGSNWHMICQCRSPECRRVIGNFDTLPAARQQWYRVRNLVPSYLQMPGDPVDSGGAGPVDARLGAA